MTKNLKTHLTKDQFLDILEQIKKRQPRLVAIYKRELSLKDKNKTLPFEDIGNDVNPAGCYYCDYEGFRFHFGDPNKPNGEIQKDGSYIVYHNEGKPTVYKPYPHKNEAERIKVTRGLNEKIQKLIEKQRGKREKLYQAEYDLQGIKGKGREKQLEKIDRLKKLCKVYPSLIPEYPVFFILKRISKNYKTISIELDNKIIYDLCLKDKEKTITSRWNKTVLEHYKDKKAKKYESYLEPFYEWFEDREIDIKKVDSLIDESKHNTKLYELNIHGMSSHPEIGTYENNLLERNKLIAKFEKAENTYQKNILMKEIKKIEGIIDQYTTLYYKAGREPIPEMKGYEPFKSIDEQPEKEAGEDSEKFTGEWDGTKIELVNDLRSDKDAGIYKTYVESYRHAEKHITVNGKPVKAKNLESLYYKTRSVS